MHPGGSRSVAVAYLVEFRSFGGQSGSPVMVRRRVFNLIQVQVNAISADAGGAEAGQETISVQNPDAEVFGFLGLVSGHFDIEQQAQTTGDILGSITTAINSGIAIVTPAEAVRELLLREDVVEDRQQVYDDAARASVQEAERATPPSRRILQSESPE
jgi:hypothetical protein